MTTLKLTSIGNSVGVVLPKELLAKLGLQKGDEPGNPAKTADPLGQGLRQGLRRAPGIGKHGVHPSRGQSAGHQAGLGRAAQQKDAVHG